MTVLQIVSLNVGQVTPLGQRRGQPVLSGICKTPVLGGGVIELTPLGLRGDQQADQRTTVDGRRIHGGTMKAVYTYPFTHYQWWQSRLWPRQLSAGMFGENLTVVGGLTEADICIGDQWQWGDALLEVTGPRRPCYKLDMRLGEGVAKTMMDSGRCGWYSRVLQPSRVPTLGAMYLIRRPSGAPTVLQAFREKITRDPTIPDLPD